MGNTEGRSDCTSRMCDGCPWYETAYRVPCQLHPVMPLVAPPHEINMHLLPVSPSPHMFATIEGTMTHLGGLLDTNNSAQASPHWFTHAVTEV
jgi:hypothetical protein